MITAKSTSNKSHQYHTPSVGCENGASPCGILPDNAQQQSDHEKTSDKPKLTVYKITYQHVKDMSDKKRLRNYHRQEEIK